MYLGSSDEKIFHLFAFFLQVQIKLKEDLEGLYCTRIISPFLIFLFILLFQGEWGR